MTNFLANLHHFFTTPRLHKLKKKIVFAVGTAPMRKENSEIQEILYATEFEKAYFVDPVYGVTEGAITIDLKALRAIDPNAHIKEHHRIITVKFMYKEKPRVAVFISGDATIEQNMPETFTIFFSGRRVGMYPGFGLRGTPSHYLTDIVGRLSHGGYLIPDRDLISDADYFFISPNELGLEEVRDIRVDGIGLYIKK